MVEALLLSVDEPQLSRCLESMHNQTVPFTNIVHINNVVPQSEAYNQGIRQLTDRWFVHTAGDVCLSLDAVEQCVKVIEDNNDEKVAGHLFSLWDSFLKLDWGGIGVFKTDVYRKFRIRNRLANDRILGKRMDRRGWTFKRHNGIYLGTHFDSPDEYQVFRRFFVAGLKYNGKRLSEMNETLENLYHKTNDLLYLTAKRAIEFAAYKHGLYPGSHNIEFEREMWEEFNAIQEKRTSI